VPTQKNHRQVRRAGGFFMLDSQPGKTQAEIGVRQSSEPEVPETSWVQMILR